MVIWFEFGIPTTSIGPSHNWFPLYKEIGPTSLGKAYPAFSIRTFSKNLHRHGCDGCTFLNCFYHMAQKLTNRYHTPNCPVNLCGRMCMVKQPEKILIVGIEFKTGR